jgi:hypothetical protein
MTLPRSPLVPEPALLVQKEEIQNQIVEFLRGIGIAVREEAIPGEPFLPGIAVEEGALILDRARNTWPGDLLHEAGHLAVLPFALRSTVNGDIPDTLLVKHAGEPEATAWAYAAIRELGLPAEVLFHEGGYKGQSTGLVFTYGAGVYPGAAGLCAAGMAITPAEARAGQAKAYPAMLRWLRA